MILITGGAGYIGSHAVKQLREAREGLVVLDNLSSGHRWAVPSDVELVVGDVGDRAAVDFLFARHRIDSVIHFAAYLSVEESVSDPLKYYRNNVAAALSLLEACVAHGVKHFIFSSTCAVYGAPEKSPIDESAPTFPVNPYGSSKLAVEEMLGALAKSRYPELRSVILRYFNVAGASATGEIGQATPHATQLIKVACEVAAGKREKLAVYGTDYDTPDGTCVRDYIHVDDLANAHLLALAYLRSGGASEIFNCGYGKGYSVKEVASAVQRVSGNEFEVEYRERRKGDAAAIWADASKIIRKLGWRPRFDDLAVICSSAWKWEQRLREREAEGPRP